MLAQSDGTGPPLVRFVRGGKPCGRVVRQTEYGHEGSGRPNAASKIELCVCGGAGIGGTCTMEPNPAAGCRARARPGGRTAIHFSASAFSAGC